MMQLWWAQAARVYGPPLDLQKPDSIPPASRSFFLLEVTPLPPRVGSMPLLESERVI